MSLACLGAAGLIHASTQANPANTELGKLATDSVSVRIGTKTFRIDLYDNPTARDLLAKLPLALKANDYPGYDEKVVRLKAPLSMEGAPRGDEPLIPEVGDCEPGNWIAFYYGPIGYWPGKVPLGKIHASIEELLALPDDATVVIEAAK
ncbi:hypothetical protein ATY79_28805 [Rhizobium sp. R693]|nr:hypothetical protein ATY79_28805 [Rhizobium sp. R693]